MNLSKIVAFLVTLIVFSTLGYLFVYQPLYGSIDIKNPLKGMNINWPQPKDKVKSTQTKKKNSQKTNSSSSSNTSYKISESTGNQIDEYKGVAVYFNGRVTNVSGRNRTPDGYNLGLKYQCVEFVKRFYYERLNHKMPDSYGHAREFFDRRVQDGGYNRTRGLYQFKNGSSSKPSEDAILVFGPSPYNSFGHVAIISKVRAEEIEIVQQNPGAMNPSRDIIPLRRSSAGWFLDGDYILGWLSR